jgi:hypothetical protein
MRIKPLGLADHSDPNPRAGGADAAPWTRCSILLLIILLSMLLAAPARTARAQLRDDEYRVKAAFLFHFSQLVDWPSDSLKSENNSLFICTLDRTPSTAFWKVRLRGRL